MSSRLLERASEAVNDLAVGPDDRIELIVGDASCPQIPRRDFDLISASLVIFFLPDPLAAL